MKYCAGGDRMPKLLENIYNFNPHVSFASPLPRPSFQSTNCIRIRVHVRCACCASIRDIRKKTTNHPRHHSEERKKICDSRSLDRLPLVHFLCWRRSFRISISVWSRIDQWVCAQREMCFDWFDWVTQTKRNGKTKEIKEKEKKKKKKTNEKKSEFKIGINGVFNGINIRTVNDSFWSVQKTSQARSLCCCCCCRKPTHSLCGRYFEQSPIRLR